MTTLRLAYLLLLVSWFLKSKLFKELNDHVKNQLFAAPDQYRLYSDSK